MHRILPLLLALCSLQQIKAATITGRVTDNTGKPLAYASVMVKGSQKGTTANSDGFYSLKLDAGNYVLVAQYVGYSRAEKNVSVGSSAITLDFILETQPLTLQEVVVKRGEDPAYEIIRQAIKKRDYYNNQVDSLSVSVYIKGLLRSEALPSRIMGSRIERSPDDGLDSAGKGILFLSESVTQVDLVRPNQIKYRVISSRESGGGYGLSFPFFVNFYQNNVGIFDNNLNPRGFISPIADGALHYYRYKYEGSFVEDGVMINTITVTPRRKNEPLFRGTIQITEDDWRIHSLDLALTRDQQLEMLDTISIKQIHAPVSADVWKTQNQVMGVYFKQFGFKIRGSFVNVYNGYVLNPGFGKKHFGRTIMSYDTAFNKKDSAWWTQVRPVALEADEKRDFVFKDSISQARRDTLRTRAHLDSLRKQRKPITLKGLLWSGQSYPVYSKRTTVSWSARPLIQQTEYNTVEGISVNLEQSLRINRSKSKNIYGIDLNSRYAFSNKHFNMWGGVKVMPKGQGFRNRYLEFAGGKRVSQFNPDNPINAATNAAYTLIGKKNYMKLYENWFGSVVYNNRFESGVRMKLSATYEDRIPLWNTTDFSFFNKDRELLPNHPYELAHMDFQKHQSFVAGVELSWQPGQKYIQFPTYKMPVGSNAPTFELKYQRAFSGVLGSDTRFDKWRFSIADNLNLKLGGEFKYRAGIGGFINRDSVGIPDLQHFNGNQTFYNVNYLNSFQLAPYYRYSNAERFFAFGHVEHHFNGLLTNKIPLFNRLKWNLVAGANTFYVNRDNYYLELFGGLENILKIFRVDVVTAIQPGLGNTWGVRLGLGGLLGGKMRFE